MYKNTQQSVLNVAFYHFNYLINSRDCYKLNPILKKCNTKYGTPCTILRVTRPPIVIGNFAPGGRLNTLYSIVAPLLP